MARRHQAALVVLYLQCEVETAISRNAARPVPAQVRDPRICSNSTPQRLHGLLTYMLKVVLTLANERCCSLPTALQPAAVTSRTSGTTLGAGAKCCIRTMIAQSSLEQSESTQKDPTPWTLSSMVPCRSLRPLCGSWRPTWSPPLLANWAAQRPSCTFKATRCLGSARFSLGEHGCHKPAPQHLESCGSVCLDNFNPAHQRLGALPSCTLSSLLS